MELNTSLDGLLSRKFTSGQIEELRKLKYTDNRDIVSMSEWEVLYYIVSASETSQEVLTFLKSRQWKNSKELILATPEFNLARTYYANRIRAMQERPEVKTNIPCVACGQKKAYLAERRQFRSGDESMTLIYNCSGCGQSWRVNP